MIYFAYISFTFLAYQLINTLINLIFRQRLKPSFDKNQDLISVLIPARNEEKNLNFLLSDFQKISKQNLEILVLDDHSTDNTSKIISEFAKKDNRIQLIKSESLPGDWLGKNHACHQLAKQAKGRYYLFIDADVRLNGNIITDSVAFMRKKNLAFLSIFPTQILSTMAEKISVPIMNYILLTLLPLIFVRISPFKSHAAANGQFMLFDAATYDLILPHKQFKKSAVEDIQIARYLKRNKHKIACLTGDNRIKCRMYQSYNDALNGFSKNVFMFFGNSAFIGFTFLTLVLFGFIPVLLEFPEYLTIYFGGLLLTLLFYSTASKQNIFIGILLFPIHMVFLFQVLANGIKIKTQKTYSWKGRYIYQ